MGSLSNSSLDSQMLILCLVRQKYVGKMLQIKLNLCLPVGV